MRQNNERHKNKYNPKTILWSVASLFMMLWFVFISNAYDKSWGFDWRGIRMEIRDSVRVIEKKPHLSNTLDPTLGIRKYADHKELLDNATLSELYALTNHPDNIVRFVAYKTLLIKRKVEAYPLLKRAINDTTAFAGTQGCYSNVVSLSAFLCEKLFYVQLDKTTAEPPPPPPAIKAEVSTYLSVEEIESLQRLYAERKDDYRKNRFAR